MTFVVTHARRGLLRRNQWRFVLVADNGETVATSETYGNRADVLATVELICARAHEATVDAHT